MIEVLYPRCSGIDVHKRFLVAGLSIVGAKGQRPKELQPFGTMTGAILTLQEWLKAAGCTHLALESTGVYWKPLYHLLEDSFEIVPFCAQHMKAVPGGKTDGKDAEWLADRLAPRVAESFLDSRQGPTGRWRSDPDAHALDAATYPSD